MARICVHEYPADGGNCPHCGLTPAQKEAHSCIWRDDNAGLDGSAPGRARLPSPTNDFDAIGKRLKELQDEADARTRESKLAVFRIFHALIPIAGAK